MLIAIYKFRTYIVGFFATSTALQPQVFSTSGFGLLEARSCHSLDLLPCDDIQLDARSFRSVQ